MSCAINSSMISTMQVPLSSQCVCVCARVCTTSVRITLIFTSVGHNHASYVVCTCPYIQTTRCVLRVCMCVCVYHYCAYRTHSYISKAQSCIVRCLHPLLHTDQQVRVACVHVCVFACTTTVRITLIFTSVRHNHASYVVCTRPYIQTTRCVLRVCMCVCVYHYCAYHIHFYISRAQ